MTTTTNKQVHWGLLGPGRIAHTFAQAIASVPECTIHMIHSSSAERANDFAKAYGIQKCTTELTQLLTNPMIDIVYIAYPHTFHFEAIKACLANGKHVLCEKPMTISTAQAEEVVALAQQNNLFLMEALWTRFLPVWQLVKQWCNEGHIGAIQQLNSSFGFSAEFDPNSRLFNPDLAGGALWDLGIYPISMTQFIVGQVPTRLTSNIVRGKTQVDEHAEITMTYDNAIQSHFTVSFREPLQNHFVIQGSHGVITVDAPFWGAETVTIDSQILQKQKTFNHLVNGFEYQIAHCSSMLQAKQIQSPIISWRDTIEAQKIIDKLI